MSKLVADHSTGGAIIGGSLEQAGFGGVVRYVAEGRGNVNLDGAEYNDLKANRLEVALVIEHEAQWLINGNIKHRVLAAEAVAKAAGVPDGVLYLACDFDSTLGGPTSPGSPGDKMMFRVLDGVMEAASVHKVGFYGSYYAIDWLHHHIQLPYYWQTAAWSRGKVHPLACLYQRPQSEKVHGVDVDINDVLKPDWGQRHVSPPPPPPPVKSTWWRAEVAVCIDGPDKNKWEVKNLPFEVR